MKSTIVKRSIVVGGHKTSVSLEDEFWSALKDIAHAQDSTLSELVGSIDAGRTHGNLPSAIRLFVLAHHRHVVMSIRSDARDGIAPQFEIGQPLRT